MTKTRFDIARARDGRDAWTSLRAFAGKRVGDAQLARLMTARYLGVTPCGAIVVQSDSPGELHQALQVGEMHRWLAGPGGHLGFSAVEISPEKERS